MFTVVDWIVYGVGLVMLAAWMVFYVKGMRYAELFEPLEEKDFPMREIYFLGYAILETFHYQYKSAADRKTKKDLSVIFGEKFIDYYIRVVYAQKITISFTMLTLTPALYGLAGGDPAIILVMLMFSWAAYYYFGTLAAEKIKKRSEELLGDFSNVVSKLALLTNAGMILHEAWEEVAYTGEGEIYQEMQAAVTEMNNGVSEMDALYRFGSRCVVPEIKKFTSTIVQGISKGSSELVEMLQEQSNEVWAAKKQNVRRQGEKAASKLMIPMMIMFFGILIMIVVPIFANLGM